MTLYLSYWTLISFSLLITSSLYWPSLPNLDYLVVAVLLLAISTKYRKARGFLGLALAFVVILFHGNLLRYQTETLFKAGADINIIAEVDSLFKPTNFGFQGFAVVRSINGQTLNVFQQPRIRLSSPIALSAGEIISASVSVKATYGLMNDVGFDAEQYGVIQGVVGNGSVSRHSSFYVVNSPSIRSQLYQSVSNRLRGLTHGAMISALLFGERKDISAQQWQSLKHSGLSHLMAISGLHIAIAFGIGWLIGLILLRASYRLHFAPSIMGLACAFGYAWLAGFSIPTQRAAIMCSFVCVMMVLPGRIPSSLKWLWVLAILLVIHPFSALSSSLWMSMIAVAIILFYQAAKRRRSSVIVSAIEMQLFLVILMSPIVAYLFHGVSISAIVYNLLFVPWFTFIVIPLLFGSLISHLLVPYFEAPWLWLDKSLSVVDLGLTLADSTWFDLSRQSMLWLLAIIAVLLIGRVVTYKYCLLVAVSVVFCLSQWRERPLWQVAVLDVGHGLSIVVEQQGKGMLYDTGAAWLNSSIAEQIVTPFMLAQGITQLDYLVISHFDSDHAGGVDPIRLKWRPKHIVTSQTGYSSTPCVAGESWQWQQITMEALWPPKTTKRAYNPHSCVVKLWHQESQAVLLLSGDIEAIAEWILVRQEGELDADIVIVPHHGSRTSSNLAFVQATTPEVAVASVAKGGRWKLPSDEVISRYQEVGAKWLDTGISGQIVFDIYPNHYEIAALRTLKGKTWYRQMLRKGVE